MTRVCRLLFPVLLASVSLAQQQQSTPPATRPPEEPPEEDASYLPKEYAFNPIQATKEISTGRFYMHKGNWKAARARFLEATRWNPGSAEGFLLLGEAHEKMNDRKAAKEAYQKYLEIEPKGKEAGSVKKRLERL